MSATAILEIPRDILDSARMSPADARLELAVTLYAQQRLAIGKARQLAGLSLWEFRQVLAARGIAPHYGASDLEDDMSSLRELGQQ